MFLCILNSISVQGEEGDSIMQSRGNTTNWPWKLPQSCINPSDAVTLIIYDMKMAGFTAQLQRFCIGLHVFLLCPPLRMPLDVKILLTHAENYCYFV